MKCNFILTPFWRDPCNEYSPQEILPSVQNLWQCLVSLGDSGVHCPLQLGCLGFFLFGLSCSFFRFKPSSFSLLLTIDPLHFEVLKGKLGVKCCQVSFSLCTSEATKKHPVSQSPMIKWQSWCFKLPPASASLGVLWGSSSAFRAFSSCSMVSFWSCLCAFSSFTSKAAASGTLICLELLDPCGSADRQFSGCVALGFFGGNGTI